MYYARRQVKRISIIGSTGSIGTQSLDIVRSRPNDFEVIALAAGSNLNSLVNQIREFKPQYVSINDPSAARDLKQLFPELEVLSGIEEIAQIENIDLVINAVVGIAGLPASIESLRRAKRVAIANKETLVAAADLVKAAQEKYKSELIPIDSEHVAIHQCLAQYLNSTNNYQESIKQILLTSSGGPFRTWEQSQFASITKEQALNHPTWKMGAKITIDSATLMNKGLEVLEAKVLFDIPLDKIQVVIHPQSIIHSAVTFVDGNTIAQMSLTDMRVPIQYAIDYPKKHPIKLDKEFDIFEIAKLEFEKPNLENFPAINLAYEAGRLGQTYPAVLNSANEAAVKLFLENKISFLEISKIIYSALEKHKAIANANIDDILDLDREIKKSLELSYF